jgi:hypothetical protein
MILCPHGQSCGHDISSTPTREIRRTSQVGHGDTTGSMNAKSLSGSPAFKVQVMCEGLRYSESLGRAALHSMPNYYPYRFKAGEHDPTGKGTATIPYLINLADGTEIRILGSGDSPWHVEGDRDQGYRLIDDRDGRRCPSSSNRCARG